MAPLQGSRHGKTETEGLLHGFARFVLTFCLSMFFVGVGDSTTLCRDSGTMLYYKFFTHYLRYLP